MTRLRLAGLVVVLVLAVALTLGRNASSPGRVRPSQTGVASVAAASPSNDFPSANPAPQEATATVGTGPGDRPAGRLGAAFAYDPIRKTSVMFGGGAGDPLKEFSDTWLWDGSRWTAAHPRSSPGPRVAASMAFDPGSGSVVLFGGDGGTSSEGPALQDTWTWDGRNWTQAHPRTSPPAGGHQALAYDDARKVLVLNAQATGGTFPYPATTWTWNGADWLQQHPQHSPPFGADAGMAFDHRAKTILLLADGSAYGSSATWSWDGLDWKQLASGTEPPGGGARLVGAAAKDDLLLASDGSLWTWSGTAWSARHPIGSPPATYMPAVTYDSDRSALVMFGGKPLASSTPNNDVYESDGTTWKRRL